MELYNCVIADTVYALAQYLLAVPKDVALNTRYFLGPSISPSISKNFKYLTEFSGKDVPSRTRRSLLRFRWRMLKLNHSQISGHPLYAQDHLFFASELIDRSRYTLLDDAPFVYSNYKNLPLVRPYHVTGLKKRVLHRLFRGPIGGSRLGTNRFCKCRFVTDRRDLDAELLHGKSFKFLDLPRLWRESADEKKDFLKHCLCVPPSFLGDENCVDTLILSQPMREDCGLTDSELIDIWRPYMTESGRICVKRHPRDHFDYRAYFPNVEYLECPAPLQILCAMGLRVKKAITITSSAVSAFSSETEVIRLGADIHPKIAATYKAV